MRRNITIGLIGDYNEFVPAHRAIPIALKRSAEILDISVEFEWVPTEQISSIARVSRFDGLWCVPASPYRNAAGDCVE
jgi:CTP synthase (UTP-ammonia lyase)